MFSYRCVATETQREREREREREQEKERERERDREIEKHKRASRKNIEKPQQKQRPHIVEDFHVFGILCAMSV